MDAAEEITNKAIAQVEAHANPKWVTVAKWAIRHVAQSQPTLTAEDVWEKMDSFPNITTHQHKAMGPIMRWAAREGMIVSTDRMVPGVREDKAIKNHNRPQRVWLSRIYSP